MGVTFQAYCAGETQARPALPPQSLLSGVVLSRWRWTWRDVRCVSEGADCARDGKWAGCRNKAGAGPCGGHSFLPIWVCGEPKDPSPPFKALPSLGANLVQTPVMVNGHFFDPEVALLPSPYCRSRSPSSALGSRSTVRPAWSCGCSPRP